MRHLPRITTALAAAVTLGVSGGAALAQGVFSFEGMEHGQVLAESAGPMTVRTLTPDARLEAFDTTRRDTNLRALEGPDDAPLPNRKWTGGNLPPLTPAGVVLRAAESPTGAVAALLTFEKSLAAVTFDLLNVEDAAEVELTLIDPNGRAVRLTLDQLLDADSPSYQPGLAFGRGTHNRLGPFDASALGIDSVAHLRVRLPLDAALDRVAMHRSSPSADAIDFAALTTDSTGGGSGGDGGGVPTSGGGNLGFLVSGGFSGGGGGDPPQQSPPNDDPGTEKDPFDELPPADANQPNGNDGQPVPSPSGALAGLALLGTLVMRRQRSRTDRNAA